MQRGSGYILSHPVLMQKTLPQMAKERSSCLLLSHMWSYKHVQNVSCFTCSSNSHTSRRSLLIRWSENTVLKISLSDWQKNLSRNSFDLSLTGKQKLSWGHIWTINSEKHPLKTPNHRVLHGLQPVVTYSDYTYEQGGRQGAIKRVQSKTLSDMLQ